MTSLFSSPKAPVSVTPIAPVVPTENNEAITTAKQQELQAISAQSGRASTILSQNDISKSDTMGG